MRWSAPNAGGQPEWLWHREYKMCDHRHIPSVFHRKLLTHDPPSSHSPATLCPSRQALAAVRAPPVEKLLERPRSLKGGLLICWSRCVSLFPSCSSALPVDYVCVLLQQRNTVHGSVLYSSSTSCACCFSQKVVLESTAVVMGCICSSVRESPVVVECNNTSQIVSSLT